MKVLNTQERQQSMRLLVKLVDINNTLSRAPLRMGDKDLRSAPSANGRARAEGNVHVKGRSL